MSEHQLWNELGNIYINSGAFEQAIKAYDKAIEVNPEFGWAFSNMALAYMRLGEPEKSVPYYQRSIELLEDFSDKAVAWHRLGNAYQVMDDTKNAIVAFQRAVDLDTDNSVYRDDLSVAMAEYVYEAEQAEEQAQAEAAAETAVEEAVAESAVRVEDDEIAEADPEVGAESVPSKNDFSAWLEQTIEKLSGKSFEKKSPAFEEEPIVFPEGVDPEDVVAELMAAVENQTSDNAALAETQDEEKEVAADENAAADDAEPVAVESETAQVEEVAPVADEEMPAEAKTAAVDEPVSETDEASAEEFESHDETDVRPVLETIVLNDPDEDPGLTVDNMVATLVAQEAQNKTAAIAEQTPVEQVESAPENVPPVPAAIAKDLIPVLETVDDDELDAHVDDLMNELSQEIDLAEDESVENDVDQIDLLAEDDEIEDEQPEEMDENELEEDEEEFEPTATLAEDEDADDDIEEEVEAEDPVEEEEDDDDGEEDDRILFELQKESAAAAMLAAENLITDNAHHDNGNGKEANMSAAKVWGELGNVFFSAGVFEGALVAYEKAIEIDANFGRALNNLALLHVRNGEYRQAVDLYRKSIDLLEDHAAQAVSWNNLGNAYRALKEYDNAEQAYRKADELDTEKIAVENWTRYGLLNTARS